MFFVSVSGARCRLRSASIVRRCQPAADSKDSQAVPEGVPLQAQTEDQTCRARQLTKKHEVKNENKFGEDNLEN